MNLRAAQQVKEDPERLGALLESAVDRLDDLLVDARAKAAGQRELPIPIGASESTVAPAPGAAHADKRILKAAIEEAMGECLLNENSDLYRKLGHVLAALDGSDTGDKHPA